MKKLFVQFVCQNKYPFAHINHKLPHPRTVEIYTSKGNERQIKQDYNIGNNAYIFLPSHAITKFVEFTKWYFYHPFRLAPCCDPHKNTKSLASTIQKSDNSCTTIQLTSITLVYYMQITKRAHNGIKRLVGHKLGPTDIINPVSSPITFLQMKETFYPWWIPHRIIITILMFWHAK